MVLFLTSNPMVQDSGGDRRMNTANGLVNRLSVYWKPEMKVLFICAFPAAELHEKNQQMAEEIQGFFLLAGLPFFSLEIWDDVNPGYDAEEIKKFDLIILSGGHVPTQNTFFQRIHLREKLSGYPGIVLGISAGSMNSAETVYAQPELEGEAENPDYKKYLKGLGLTRIMVLPHYQMLKNGVLDGRKIFEEITYPDSKGKKFYCLVDGSYLLIENGKTILYGEGYLISDGILQKICSKGEEIVLSESD